MTTVHIPEAQGGDSGDPQAFLADLLVSDRFQAAMRRLARYTVRAGMEGGYAAYENGSSGLDLPDPEAIARGTRNQLLTTSWAFGYGSFDDINLMYHERESEAETDDQDTSTLRRDVRLFVHSHPIAIGYEHVWSDELAPSPDDLEGWEQRVRRLPYLTEGVLVATRDVSRLLLWHKHPQTPGDAHYALVERGKSRGVTLRAMRDSGIQLAELDMCAPADVYVEQAREAVGALFAADPRP